MLNVTQPVQEHLRALREKLEAQTNRDHGSKKLVCEDTGSEMMEKGSTCGGIAFDVKIPAGTAARPSTAKRLEGRKRRLTKEELEEKMKGVEQRREVSVPITFIC